MDKYFDIYETKVDIAELEEGKNKDVLAVLEFPFGVSGKINLNKRYYPDQVWKDAINGLDKKIQASFVPGTAGHPMGGAGTPLKDVSHILTKVWVDENKKGWARATVLNTEPGRTTMTVLKSGTKKIGASLRGFGETDSNGAVKRGLELKTIDLVIDPSFAQDATLTPANIIESTIIGEAKEQGETDIGNLSQDELRVAGSHIKARLTEGKVGQRTKQEGSLFCEYIVAGGGLSFEDWKKEFGGEDA